MRSNIRARLTLPRLAVALVLLGALGAAAAYASGSSFIGPHGYINACVPPRGGEVNVWKPGHGCSGGRVSLAFAAHAQNGAAGATGPKGATGDTGPTGATGPSNPAATTVDGETVTKLQLKEATPASVTTTATLFSNDGLQIIASCDSSGNASLAANGSLSADSDLTVSGFQHGTGAFGSQTAALGSTSNAPLGPSPAGHTTFSYVNSAGQVITGEIGYQSAPSLGTFAGCDFFGTILSG